MSTPSPYLRDRLLQAADGLRKDAESARLTLAQAERDVAEAREILAEAEAQHDRARAEVDGIEAGIAWAQAHAATITREIDADPAAKLRATGLMRHEPKAVDPAPVPYAEHIGHRVDVMTTDLERTRGHLVRIANGWLTLRGPEGEMSIPDEQVRHVARAEGSLHLEDDDDLTAPGVADSRAQIAPHLPPPVPHEPAGHLVATSGPTTTAPIDPAVTAPDAGLAHPVPNPPSPTAEARHARPGEGLVSRVTGGWPVVGRRRKTDEQDGDADE